jgi:P pilus assembly chaperone PapD
LNVQEIPPKPKETDGSVLAIAMNTQVKLIYRPKSLTDGRKEAEKQLTLVNRDGSVWIKKPDTVLLRGDEGKKPRERGEAE